MHQVPGPASCYLCFPLGGAGSLTAPAQGRPPGQALGPQAHALSAGRGPWHKGNCNCGARAVTTKGEHREGPAAAGKAALHSSTGPGPSPAQRSLAVAHPLHPPARRWAAAGGTNALAAEQRQTPHHTEHQDASAAPTAPQELRLSTDDSTPPKNQHPCPTRMSDCPHLDALLLLLALPDLLRLLVQEALRDAAPRLARAHQQRPKLLRRGGRRGR